jgi:hypothetical protein
MTRREDAEITAGTTPSIARDHRPWLLDIWRKMALYFTHVKEGWRE